MHLISSSTEQTKSDFLRLEKGDNEPNFPSKNDYFIRSEMINDLPKLSHLDGKSLLGKQKRLPKAGSIARDYIRWCRQTTVPSGRKKGPLLPSLREQ